MADHSITITNSLNLFGIAPATKWDQWNWGSFFWGEGTEDLPCAVGKLVSNALAPSDAYSRSIGKRIENTLDVAHDMGSEVLTDGAGYTYVFPDSATDGEDRDFATWVDGSGDAAGWSSVSGTSASWTES